MIFKPIVSGEWSKDQQCFTKCATSFERMAYRALPVGASRMLIDEECVHASPASLSATRASRFDDRKWGDRLVPITWVPDEARAESLTSLVMRLRS